MPHRFNPDLDHRRSIRLPGHNYTHDAAVFVTICTRERALLFGHVLNEAVELSELGRVVSRCWWAISKHFHGVDLDEFVVMPNHMHGILLLNNGSLSVGARHASPWGPEEVPEARTMSASGGSPLRTERPHGPAPGSVGAIVGSFKAAVSRQVNDLRGTLGTPIWQRNYYEHVVRTEADLARIREYIIANPMNWVRDELYLSDRLP